MIVICPKNKGCKDKGCHHGTAHIKTEYCRSATPCPACEEDIKKIRKDKLDKILK